MSMLRSSVVAGSISVALVCSQAPAAAAIAAGDHLTIHVYNHPELSTTATVDSRGEIQLPLIGIVHVTGLEPTDVARTIRIRITPFVPYPAVDVQDVSESETIFVSGGPSGVLPYAPNESLSAAVAEIAKSTQYSDPSQAPPNAHLNLLDRSRIDLRRVAVYRDGRRLGVFDIIAARETGDPGPILQANDTISFSNKPVAVIVTGAVNTPGTAFLWPEEPLSDAIAQAGGPSSTAASGHVEFSRAGQPSQQLALGDSTFNHSAAPGDTITIPTAPRITVEGLVEHPGVVALHSDFSLMSALAAAGGYNKYGDLRKVQVVHQGVTTQYNIVALAHGDLTQNPVLSDGDTVFVPEGHKIDWAQVFQGIGGLGGLTNLGLTLRNQP